MIRFGLGLQAGTPPPAEPEVWLLEQLHGPDPARFDPPFTAADGLMALRQDRLRKPRPEESLSRQAYRSQAAAEMAWAIATPTPFRERLVWFWTNHFTVSLRRGECAALAGAFVEEAIRPHVAGRFSDMLLAVMRHPAMLLYLDNAQSVGPGSAAGQRSGRGLNENLARECLELHTLSPAAGYTQADVTNFAKILTGWSIELKDDPPGFRFRPGAHEPGVHSILQTDFPPGEAGGIAALAFLAEHPATHRFLANRLACHFVADTPSPATVRAIEGVLRDTNGDLGAAASALVRLDEAWTPLAKLRTPQDYVVAVLRGFAAQSSAVPVLGVLSGLGQPLWSAPAPNGWPDQAVDWSSPEALLRRIDWANGFAGRIANHDPAEAAEAMLGPLIRPETLVAMHRAGSRHDAMTLLLTSPECQRR